MGSYIVLSPPGGEARSERNRFVKDGFAIWAALFPFLWALSKRLYLEAVVLFAFEAGVFLISLDPFLDLPASAFSLALGILWGLEARNWQISRLEKAGWQQQAVISAQSLGDAEAMFYGSVTVTPEREAPRGWQPTNKPLPSAGNTFALGLMDYEKGRP